MKKGFVFFVIFLILSGCTGTAHVYLYKPVGEKKYTADKDYAVVINRNSRWFKSRGYRVIAKLGVSQHLRRCLNGEKCTNYDHDKNIIRYLGEEAAKKGGHYVQFSKQGVWKAKAKEVDTRCIRSRSVKKCKQVRSIHHSGYDTVCNHYTECLEYAKNKTGVDYWRWAQGYIWRKGR